MKVKCLLLSLLLLSACKHARKVNTSFYYWKTIYRHHKIEDAYLGPFHTANLYVRIMDVDRDYDGALVPVSPIEFKDKLSAGVQIIPVVYIVNNALKDNTTMQLNYLAANIANFVDAKVKQAGKHSFTELQIDCDWTAATRDKYFHLLNALKGEPKIKGKTISVTLRLHQLKNKKTSGIPPANRVMLMCYNMGNLRRYGTQNSIMALDELKKYLGDNLSSYPLKVDIALPLFSWAVAFRQKEYIGISRQVNLGTLNNKTCFVYNNHNLYTAVTDLPQFGLQKSDEIRWEGTPQSELENIAKYLSRFVHTDTLNITYFHLDENLLKTHPHASLETISNLLR
jgi:hypothetical protein